MFRYQSGDQGNEQNPPSNLDLKQQQQQQQQINSRTTSAPTSPLKDKKGFFGKVI